MSRSYVLSAAALLSLASLATGCASNSQASAAESGTPAAEPTAVSIVAVESRPLERQLRVTGSVGYTAATWVRTMKLLAQGLRPSRIVTHRLPLERWQEGFDVFERKEALKVLLQPRG